MPVQSYIHALERKPLKNFTQVTEQPRAPVPGHAENSPGIPQENVFKINMVRHVSRLRRQIEGGVLD